MYFLILGRIHAWSGWGLLVFSLGSLTYLTNSVLSVHMKKLCGAIWWFHQFTGLTHEACWLNPLWFRCGPKNPIAKPLAKLPVTDAFDDRFVMGSNLYFSSMWGLPFCVKMFPMTLCTTQASLWFTVGWATWQCWKLPSLVLRVSSETGSLLCRTPGTDVSAPLSMLGGATTWFRMSTLMPHGDYLLKTWGTLHSLYIFSCRNPWWSP